LGQDERLDLILDVKSGSLGRKIINDKLKEIVASCKSQQENSR
jgi:hypothetical protein